MIRTSVREVSISDAEAGQRLDNFLLRELKGVPRSRVYKMFRKGEVRVNKGRIKPHYKVKAGDIVRIPPVTLDGIKKDPYITDSNKEVIRNSVLVDDADLLQINKPAGMPVHAGSKLSYGVIEAVRATYPELEFVELAHRLDRFTSGCLLLAKNRAILQEIHTALRDHTAVKHYFCLVAGKWPQDISEITTKLKRERGGKQSRTIVSESGKSAKSVFTLVQSYANASLMKVSIHTGRTHQIRVHAASSGHPVLGDEIYGNHELNREFSKKGLKRQFLHASSMELVLNNETRIFNAPLPGELNAVLDRI